VQNDDFGISHHSMDSQAPKYERLAANQHRRRWKAQVLGLSQARNQKQESTGEYSEY
jgi:hypothetical protein